MWIDRCELSRRHVVTGLTAMGLAGRPSAALTDDVKVVAVLVGQGSEQQGQWRIDAFRTALKSRGWIDGQNLSLVFAWPEGNPEKAKSFAAEFVSRNAHVLVATNTFATKALMAATERIPIVFANVTDPVSSGLVPSLSRPGGNVTGFTDMEPSVAGKWTVLLKDLVPSLRTVVMVHSPEVTGSFLQSYKTWFVQTAAQLGIDHRIEMVRTLEDYAGAFEACGREMDCGILVVDDALFARNIQPVIALAAKHKVPSVYGAIGYVTIFGGLIAYGVSLVGLYDQASGYISRILRGDRAGDLPVQTPTAFQLAVNRAAAGALAIELPLSILAAADFVVDVDRSGRSTVECKGAQCR